MTEFTFDIGHFVVKKKGAKFWGMVISRYEIPFGPLTGQVRYDVMAIDPGFLGTIHIFAEDQMEKCDQWEIKDFIEKNWDDYSKPTQLQLLNMSFYGPTRDLDND